MASSAKTIYTAVGSTELQFSPIEWTLISLQLDTAGPVTVGFLAELQPLASGRGVYLSDKPRYMLVGPQDHVYTYSDSLNRITMLAHPLPNFMQIIMKLDGILGKLLGKR